MEQIETDIAIVGAGPVGLLLAILLGRQGHDATVVERWPEIYDRPRAVTMDAEVARILAMLGIDCDTDPDFENPSELYYWKNADLENLQIVDWESRAPCGWHVTHWFNQPRLEARLMAMLADLPTVRLLRGWTAKSLDRDGERATLGVAETGQGAGRKRIKARYLVGADGANSFVRDALGLPIIDTGYFFDWLILDMIPPARDRAEPAQWQLCDPARPTTIVPGGPGRRRWEFMVLPGEDKDALATEDSAWRLLEPWGLTPETATLERSAIYTLEARWAERWVKGRAMIAGDAAHLMPPFVGEGMCAGLRDAVALGWRLDGLLRGQLTESVLASYESERIAHARHYIQFSQDLGDIICITDPDEAAARDPAPITGDLVSLGPGAWVESPGAGELSPQGMVRMAGREGRFDQVVGTGWCILTWPRPEDDPLTRSQADSFARLGGWCIALGRDVEMLDEACTTWEAETGARYAILRPDFYVAATATDTGSLRAAFDTLLERLGLLQDA